MTEERRKENVGARLRVKEWCFEQQYVFEGSSVAGDRTGAVTVFKQFDKPRVQEGVSYSQFMDDAKNGKVKNVVVQGRNLTVTPADGQKYQIVSPGDIWMVGDLMKYGVRSAARPTTSPMR
jgi:ATP-dependent Zn protease